jgi:hypothetical protein
MKSLDRRLNEIIEAFGRLHWASRKIIDAEVKELCAAYPDVPSALFKACEIAAREREAEKI